MPSDCFAMQRMHLSEHYQLLNGQVSIVFKINLTFNYYQLTSMNNNHLNFIKRLEGYRFTTH